MQDTINLLFYVHNAEGFIPPDMIQGPHGPMRLQFVQELLGGVIGTSLGITAADRGSLVAEELVHQARPPASLDEPWPLLFTFTVDPVPDWSPREAWLELVKLAQALQPALAQSFGWGRVECQPVVI